MSQKSLKPPRPLKGFANKSIISQLMMLVSCGWTKQSYYNFLKLKSLIWEDYVGDHPRSLLVLQLTTF
jgi:hypothetical protein